MLIKTVLLHLQKRSMQSIRNIAIIAHVDHGKTTLVDKIIAECKTLDQRKEVTDLLLDSNDLERERGITILSKNVSVNYKNVKINIIDTPGHADFSGEVERVLKMADGVLLLVDAFEGPMPQTRFVLNKALMLGLKPIVVINKVDKFNCRPEEVQQDVFELMFNLDATEDQLDFVTIFGSSKQGWMTTDLNIPSTNVIPLLDSILENVPEAPYREGTPQMQISSLDHSNYVGRISIGRIFRGDLYEGKYYTLCQKAGKRTKVKIKELFIFEGLGKTKVQQARSGDICAIVGFEEFEIGDTLADLDAPEPLPRIAIDEPTMSMLFVINNSPFLGQEGKFVTSRHLRERLFKEMEKNLALKVELTDKEDRFSVFGRGILHLSILIETMRREGYEFQVGKPKVIFKTIDDIKCEPFETLVIDVPEQFAGKAIELVSQKKGELLVMEPKSDLQHLEFIIPARGLIGLRNNVLTATTGTAVMTHRFSGYQAYKGEINERMAGSLIAIEGGQALAYALFRLSDRGKFFIDPGEQIYKGQVIGEHTRDNDIDVAATKGKKLTNMRASGTDESTKVSPKIQFSLEEAMEYIKEDEYLEITPKSLRMRKISYKVAKFQ
jgi:GTP-binding protein